MKKTILTTLTLLVLMTAARAGVVFSDTFDYPNGGIVSNSAGVWVPNTGTANSMLVSNQSLVVSTSRSEDIAASLGATFATNGATPALYASFKLKCTGLPSAGGAYLAHFTGANTFGALTGHRGRVWAATTNVLAGQIANPGNFLLYIFNSTNNLTPAQWPNELATNQTYTIVIKYEIATLTATLWVDPAAESDPSVTGVDYPADLFDAANGLVNVTHYAFRQASGEGTMWIDDLKIGTAFNDVAGANTAPLISAIANQSLPMNGQTGPLAFTVQDAETPASGLIVSNSSSNPTLFPPGGIVISGADTNRTITVTPATGQQGSGTITLYVSDGANTSSTSFLIRVGAPSISAIPNQISTVNIATAAIPFTISDAEGDNFTLSSGYSNPGLIGSVNFGGSGGNRTVTITPATDQVGLSTISIIASDGFNTVTQSFTVTFAPLLGLIYSDDFSYPDGTLYLNGSWSLTSGSAGETQVTNGMVLLVRTNSEDLNTGSGFNGAPFAPASAVVLYSGFTLNVRELPTSSGNYFAHFKDNSTAGFRARVFVGTSGADPGHCRIGIANNSSSASAQVPIDLATNITYLVVTRYNTANGESAVWVNPKSAADPPTVAADALNTMTVYQYAFRQDTGIGTLLLDDLKIGTSLTDVATIPSLTQTLSSSVSAGVLTLTWSAPLFALQSSSSINGPWTTIPGAASPYVTSATEGEMYFRLKY